MNVSDEDAVTTPLPVTDPLPASTKALEPIPDRTEYIEPFTEKDRTDVALPETVPMSVDVLVNTLDAEPRSAPVDPPPEDVEKTPA